MNPRNPIISGVAKVLVLLGVLPLMAGIGYALFEGLADPTRGLNLAAVFLLLAGAPPSPPASPSTAGPADRPTPTPRGSRSSHILPANKVLVPPDPLAVGKANRRRAT